MINSYYGHDCIEDEEISNWDLVAKTLTGGATTHWPSTESNVLYSADLSSKFVILHRLLTYNWIPSAHHYIVSKDLLLLSCSELGLRRCST